MNNTSAEQPPGCGCWLLQVYDIFDGGVVLDKTVTTTITIPEVEYIVERNQQVECLAVYSTLDLKIPYTFTAVFLFDADGNVSLATSAAGGSSTSTVCMCRSSHAVANQGQCFCCGISTTGIYNAASYTDIRASVAVTNVSGATSGERCIFRVYAGHQTPAIKKTRLVHQTQTSDFAARWGGIATNGSGMAATGAHHLLNAITSMNCGCTYCYREFKNYLHQHQRQVTLQGPGGMPGWGMHLC